ncbi:MAG: GAF domain-containing protein [Gomphosphaeria aponina SAG 52.96 = DSM 107014]|uniref:Circadian input-output histidine kinase CikA n=1 Tax=Gomphosphaeria aponina SAG 52.96 = DSM 107014 TaxID=1521640 RepID=A0A941GTH2_9CHRO|nr:GAF domain-containing protein [Gomphosphaeria aponina SAG 52.96 = DSM 107014]
MIQVMRKTLILDEILKGTANILHERLKVTGCLICSKLGEKMRVRGVSQATVKSENLVDLIFDISNYYHSLLVTGKPVVIGKTEKCVSHKIRKTCQREEVRSLVIFPMFYQESYLGEIWLHCQWEHEWQENELNIVSIIAAQCAMSLHQAQLSVQIQQHRLGEQLIQQISQRINSNLDAEEVIQEILQKIGESFQINQVILFRLDQVNIQIYQKWPMNNPLSGKVTPELLEMQEQYLIKEQDNYVQKKQQKEQILENPEYFQSDFALSVPIFIHQKLFGSLTLQTTTKQRNFTPEEIYTIKQIAEQIAIPLHLEQLVKARIQQLEAEKQSIEAANRAKSEFLSHMSHELRTPLTAIIGFSRMLIQQLYGELNPKQMQYVSGIYDSGQHLLDLINDLLDISKIEAERFELFMEKVPVEEICLASISIIQERAKQQGLELVLDIDQEVDFCVADHRCLKQILLNLLSNAVKFTETGSVTLKVQKNKKMLLFSVIDTGIGIKEDDQKKLFEAFSQIDTYLHRQHKGTGLGLALSRKLARLHGGDLTLSSESGKGSCFTLHLPIPCHVSN